MRAWTLLVVKIRQAAGWIKHRHLKSGPPFFLIWSLPRLWYGSLSRSISLNHLSICYNISCYNSLVLITLVFRSSCRITYIYHRHSNSGPPFSSFGPSRDYGMDLCLEVYLWTIYPYFTTFCVTTFSFY